ncbi:MAG: tetratricopeptide repeat protein [Sphingomicrobium sp.]
MIFAIAAAVAAAAPAAHCPDLVTPDALVCRALDAQKNGQTEEAAAGFEEAAKASGEKDPKTAGLWAAAGNLWIEANQPGKAALDIDKALALPSLEGEQRGQALLDRARAAEAQNDLKTARAKLTDAASMIPDDPFVWYFSASLAIREGDVATAQSSIGRALKLAGDDPAVLFEAGHVAHFAGDDTNARYYWQRSASLDRTGPVGKAARDALAMLPAPPTVVTRAPTKPK